MDFIIKFAHKEDVRRTTILYCSVCGWYRLVVLYAVQFLSVRNTEIVYQYTQLIVRRNCITHPAVDLVWFGALCFQPVRFTDEKSVFVDAYFNSCFFFLNFYLLLMSKFGIIFQLYCSTNTHTIDRMCVRVYLWKC